MAANSEIEYRAKERQYKICLLRDLINRKIGLGHLRKPTRAFWIKEGNLYKLQTNTENSLPFIKEGTIITESEYNELSEKYCREGGLWFVLHVPEGRTRGIAETFKNELEQQQRAQRED